MSFRQHEYIVAVADCGGFKGASELLNVSQPTISIQIRKFEALIGVDIFDRSTHPIQTTEVGEFIVSQARHILSLKIQLQNFVDENRSK